VVINSGRDAEFLDKWFSGLNLNLAAEHGAFFKENGKWHENISTKFPDDEELLDVLQKTTDKTPGSRIEMKKNSIAWHYRNCDKWLAGLRQQQLVNALMTPCTRLNLQIMRGNKVIEVKIVGVDKGIEVTRLMSADNYDFIMAMGDDITDEDMFHTMPPEAITIKVGSISNHARFSLPQLETVKFLNNLISKE